MAQEFERNYTKVAPVDDDENGDDEDEDGDDDRFTSIVTVFDLYRYAVTAFSKADLSYGHTTLTPWEDASFLIMHELALPHKDPIIHWGSARLMKSEKEHLLSLIDRRVEERVPTPYLVKGCYFQDEYFFVDERVLVPRSFLGEILCNKDLVGSGKARSATDPRPVLSTTALCELDYSDYMGEVTDEAKASAPSAVAFLPHTQPAAASSLLIDTDTVHNVLDLCTGSACLPVLAHRVFTRAKRIHAVDISRDALEVAEINLESKGLEGKIKLLQGDMFAALGRSGTAGTKYDLILCNPPYVTSEDMDHLPEEYRHEPGLALEAGRDGLRVLHKLLAGAAQHLSERGALLVEVGQCKPALLKAYPQLFAAEGVRWVGTSESRDEVFFAPRAALCVPGAVPATDFPDPHGPTPAGPRRPRGGAEAAARPARRS